MNMLNRRWTAAKACVSERGAVGKTPSTSRPILMSVAAAKPSALLHQPLLRLVASLRVVRCFANPHEQRAATPASSPKCAHAAYRWPGPPPAPLRLTQLGPHPRGAWRGSPGPELVACMPLASAQSTSKARPLLLTFTLAHGDSTARTSTPRTWCSMVTCTAAFILTVAACPTKSDSQGLTRQVTARRRCTAARPERDRRRH